MAVPSPVTIFYQSECLISGWHGYANQKIFDDICSCEYSIHFGFKIILRLDFSSAYVSHKILLQCLHLRWKVFTVLVCNSHRSLKSLTMMIVTRFWHLPWNGFSCENFKSSVIKSRRRRRHLEAGKIHSDLEMRGGWKLRHFYVHGWDIGTWYGAMRGAGDAISRNRKRERKYKVFEINIEQYYCCLPCRFPPMQLFCVLIIEHS